MNGFSIHTLDWTLVWKDGKILVKLGLLGLGISGRKGISLFGFTFSTGKDWGFMVMLCGLKLGSYLDQPDLSDVDLAEDLSSEDILAVRKWEWGFNYFQKPEKAYGAVSHVI